MTFVYWLTHYVYKGCRVTFFYIGAYMGDFKNSYGTYDGYKWTSTNKQVLVFTPDGIKVARVKREEDFDFEVLFNFAVKCGD